jgi:hypothetical protein
MNTAKNTESHRNLPGWELVAEGLADVRAKRTTPAAALIWIAAPRLRQAALLEDSLTDRRMADPELQLYRMLRQEGGNAYGRYNSLLRRLVRFEHALDRAAVR